MMPGDFKNRRSSPESVGSFSVGRLLRRGRQGTRWLHALSLLLVVAACGPDANDPKSEEQVLLDHAIEALWGEVSAESVATLRTRSILVQKNDGYSSTFELESLLGDQGEYRESRVWEDYGLEEVFATNGKGSWYLVDGTLVKSQEEAEAGPGRDQVWLFELSKLKVLKDGKRFDLSYEGKETLEDGTELKRLRVQDNQRAGFILDLDIDLNSWLVRRVVLNDSRGKHSFTLLLDDYKKVGGVQFAHSIVQKLDGKPFAKQTVQEIELNPNLDQDDFVAPVAGAAMQVVRKPSIGGWVAWRELEQDEPAAELSSLKDWITQNGLEIAGPMIVLNGDSKAEAGSPLVRKLALAIKAPQPEMLSKLPKTTDFGVAELQSQPSLCATAEGEAAQTEALNAITKAIDQQNLKSTNPMIEVYFARDGAIRQIQIPIQ